MNGSSNCESTSKKSIKNNKKVSAAAIIAAAVAASWILIELLIFILSIPGHPEVNAEDYCRRKTENGVYLIDKDTTLVFAPQCGAIDSVSFYAEAVDPAEYTDVLLEVKIKGYDPATTASMLTYNTEKFLVGENGEVRTVLRADVERSAGRIEIVFTYEGFDYTVRALTFNSPKDAKFNFARTAVVLIAVLGLWACTHFGLWKKYFDPQNKKHAVAALVLCTLCVLMSVLFVSAFNSSGKPTVYPFKFDPVYYNPYEQQFDAFMKGQIHLDLEPSEELKELENPYDPANRIGVDYSWDRAYYNGKYYSYFGLGPLVSVYFPYYAVTGDLPADNFVTAVFTIVTALFFSLAAVKWAAMYTKKLPLPLLFVGVIGALFSSQVFLIMRGRSKFYYIATIAGMAFMSIFIWFLLCGISGTAKLASLEKDERKRLPVLVFYALAGVAYGFLFLSRFNMALLAAFAVLPFIWFNIITGKSDGEKGRRVKFRKLADIVFELLALGIPVVAVVVFQLVFNSMRFDSLFEFGTTYQLTVSDISQNKIRLSDIPSAIYHYFIQPLALSIKYPFFSLGYVNLGNYGHYSYIDTGMGLLTNPMMWTLFGSVAIFANKKRRLSQKVILGAVILGSVIVALFDFCLGGVIFRYTCDITLMLAFAAMAIMFWIHEDMEESGELAAKQSRMVFLLITAAAVLVCFILSTSLNVNLTAYPVKLFVKFKEFFTFF